MYRVLAFIGCLATTNTLARAQENASELGADTTFELSIFFAQSSGEYGYDTASPVAKAAHEFTGVTLVNFPAPAASSPDSVLEFFVNLETYPDIMGGAGLRSTVNALGPQGAFLPLDQLIADHAPHISAYFEAHAESIDGIRAHDGALYHIPAFLSPADGEAWLIREDWLNTLDLAYPETAGELYEALTAFKTRDPNGNSVADEVPYFSAHPNGLTRLLAHISDDRESLAGHEGFYLDGDHIKHGFGDMQFRNGIRTLAKWFYEGLIDPAVATGVGSARDQLLRGDLGGLTYDRIWVTDYNRILQSPIPGFALAPLAPGAHSANIADGGWAISYSNPDPVMTIKYFDFWFSPAGQRLASFGVEGEHYDLINGRPVLREAVREGPVPVQAYMRSSGAQILRGAPVDPEFFNQTQSPTAAEAMKLNANAHANAGVQIHMTNREQRVYDQFWPSIEIYIAKQMRRWVSGEANIDADWEQYLETLTTMGLPIVEDVLNEAYAREQCICHSERPLPFSRASHETLAHSAAKITDEPITLSIRFHSYGRVRAYDETWPVEEAASSITGISLRDFPIDGALTASEAIEAMVAGDRFPDIFGGTKVQNDVRYWGPQGAFVPLDDLIHEHAPHIRDFFAQRPDLIDTARALDGRLYHIPFFPDGPAPVGYFIRHDWLEKLGLEVPQTVGELHATLIAFRDEDPNGNGLADEVPIFARRFGDILTMVTMWDARSTGSQAPLDFYLENGEIKHGATSEAYKTAIRNLRQWYAEGLIDPVVAEGISSDRDALLRNNLGGFTHDWIGTTADFNSILEDEIEGFSFRVIAPPASATGRRLEELGERAPITEDGWAISFSNPNPVETIKYFDFWFSPEGKRLANFGVAGQHYEIIDGKPIFLTSINDGQRPPPLNLRDIGAQLPRGYPQDFFFESQWLHEAALEGMALYDSADFASGYFTSPPLSDAQQRLYTRRFNPLRSYMQDTAMSWVRGETDIDETWDEYLATVEDMGLEDLLSIMNAAYQRDICACAQ